MNNLFVPSADRLVWAVVLSSIFMFSAVAQNATLTVITPQTPPAAKGIGPAPANTKQGDIMSNALSDDTRQTLQEAMNSYGPVGAPSAKAKAK